MTVHFTIKWLYRHTYKMCFFQISLVDFIKQRFLAVFYKVTDKMLMSFNYSNTELKYIVLLPFYLKTTAIPACRASSADMTAECGPHDEVIRHSHSSCKLEASCSKNNHCYKTCKTEKNKVLWMTLNNKWIIKKCMKSRTVNACRLRWSYKLL